MESSLTKACGHCALRFAKESDRARHFREVHQQAETFIISGKAVLVTKNSDHKLECPIAGCKSSYGRRRQLALHIDKHAAVDEKRAESLRKASRKVHSGDITRREKE